MLLSTMASVALVCRMLLLRGILQGLQGSFSFASNLQPTLTLQRLDPTYLDNNHTQRSPQDTLEGIQYSCVSVESNGEPWLRPHVDMLKPGMHASVRCS